MTWYNNPLLLSLFHVISLGIAIAAATPTNPTTNPSLVDDLLSSIANAAAANCVSCHGLILSLKATAHLGDDKFVNALTSICKTLKLQDPDVCEGVFIGPGPIIAHDLRSIPSTGETSDRLCNAMLGVCKQPPVKNYTVPFPKPKPLSHVPTTPFPRRKPFQVVHFSDVHIDRDYTPNSEANCTKPICCRPFEDQNDPVTVPAGPMGDHRCDSPTGLAESLFEAIEETNSSFALFTGDIVDGAVWLINKTDVKMDFASFLGLTSSSKISIPIYPALGNHEVAPVNSYPRNTSKGHEDEAQWVFDMAGVGWEKWLGPEASAQVIHHSGSYSVLVPGMNLRIISLNTGFWYKVNFWLYDSTEHQPDPNGILSFLVSQLQLAEDANERVWIMGHMPMGGGDVVYDQSNYYDQVIQRYHQMIVGQFFGHTHADEFQIAYSNYTDQTKDTATSISWIAPALTPRSGNPAFKVYDVDPDTYEVMDMKVYYSNLLDKDYQNKPSWSLLYSARDLYGSLISEDAGASVGISPSSALTPGFWHQVTEAFERNDAAYRMYDLYKRRDGGQCIGLNDTEPVTFEDEDVEDRSKGEDLKSMSKLKGKNQDEKSDYTQCKERTICGLRAARSENNCALLQRGFGIGRTLDGESRGGDGHADECESLGVGDVMVQMVEAVAAALYGSEPVDANVKSDSESTLSTVKSRLERILLAEGHLPIADSYSHQQVVAGVSW